eukprot:4873077-Pleurochrysis_carterae.AAC.2
MHGEPSRGGHTPRVFRVVDCSAPHTALGLLHEYLSHHASPLLVPRLSQMTEYLVKLRGVSYMQSKWLCEADIEMDGTLSTNILRKFQRRIGTGEAVDKTYLQHMSVDRVLAHRYQCAAAEPAAAVLTPHRTGSECSFTIALSRTQSCMPT